MADRANSNNTIILGGCIQEFKENNELSLRDDDIFEIFSVTQVTKNIELSYEDIEQSIVDGGQDGGIDSFLILVNEIVVSTDDQLEELKFTPNTTVTILISQAKTEKTHTESTLDKLIASIPLFFDLELSDQGLLLRFNPRLVEKLLTFRKVWQLAMRKGARIKIEYCYASKANEVDINSIFDSKVQQIIDFTKDKINGAEVSFTILSAKELLELYYKSIQNDLDLTFKETPLSITYKENHIGYIGNVKLPDFLDLIRDRDGTIRENIFESNVRHYQGDVDVNREIQETLTNETERDFWWLNNGITIISSKVRQIGKKLTLCDVQIVNGLQTSFTIANYYSPNSDDDRSILVKVIENDDKETIDKIISSTNRQSPVSPALLRATEETQRTIELYFYNKGYFYDRRKNYYKNQGKPASKIFSIQYTAQAIEAIKNFSPALARAKPTTLIKSDVTYNKIFDPHVDFDVYLNCCLIVQRVMNFIGNGLMKEEKSPTRNFTYHLARIVTSFVINKAHYNNADIKNITLSDIDNQVESAYDKLLEMVIAYNESKPDENVINISKSQKFVEYMNEELRKIYSQ